MDDVVDIQRIADVIMEAGADVVALQEVDVGVERSGRIDIVKELAERTGLEHTVFGKNIDYQGGDYGNATISRFPVKKSKNVRFEQLGVERRSILTTLIDVNGFSLLLMNTHLDYSGDDSERVLFARKARDEVIPRFQANAVIFTGDFNDVPDSRTYRIVTGYLKDSWTGLKDAEDGFTFPSDVPEKRIDFIFHDEGLEPVETTVPDTQASDHLPVVTTFRIAEN